MPALPPQQSGQPTPGPVPGEIRVGSTTKTYNQELILSDKPPWTAKRVLGAVAEVLLVLLLPTFTMAAFGIWQMARPDQVRTTDTPAQYKLEYKSLVLHTADGYDIAAWDVAPTTPSEDAILVLPGYAADKGSILPRTAFLGQNHRLLYIDFRSFGQSSGRYSTMGLREVEDALAGVRYLKEQGAKRIGIYGFTMGGAVALMTAAREPAVTAIVTEDAYSDFDAVISQPYVYLGPAKPFFGKVAKTFVQSVLRMNIDAVSPAGVAASLHLPALIIHSSADPSVPVSHADLLRSRISANDDVRFWYTDGKTDLAARTEFAQTVLAFFNRHLVPPVNVTP